MITIKFVLATLGWLIGFYALAILAVGSWAMFLAIIFTLVASELITHFIKNKKSVDEAVI